MGVAIKYNNVVTTLPKGENTKKATLPCTGLLMETDIEITEKDCLAGKFQFFSNGLNLPVGIGTIVLWLTSGYFTIPGYATQFDQIESNATTVGGSPVIQLRYREKSTQTWTTMCTVRGTLNNVSYTWVSDDRRTIDFGSTPITPAIGYEWLLANTNNL